MGARRTKSFSGCACTSGGTAPPMRLYTFCPRSEGPWMLRVALEPYLYVVSLVGLGLGLVPAPALAASPRAEAALEEMVEMNRKALDELRLGKHEAARDDLLRAVNMG